VLAGQALYHLSHSVRPLLIIFQVGSRVCAQSQPETEILPPIAILPFSASPVAAMTGVGIVPSPLHSFLNMLNSRVSQSQQGDLGFE
jgi:hypothetical protein